MNRSRIQRQSTTVLRDREPIRRPSVRSKTTRRITAVDPALIERVKCHKAQRKSSPLRYRNHSQVAFIVHSFNRASNIDRLAAGLRLLGDHELIVCEDGSLDGSRQKWMSHLVRPNDFLILSNDLHEIRILDRAIRFARAEIICLVQDDDLIPQDTGWLRTALALFHRHPNLAIIGGFMGFSSFHPDPMKAKPIWGPAPFRFVHHVNIGPYSIRKRHYEALGGWDYSFSGVGEPGICFDNELCLRAWINGYQVGYSFVPFKGPPGHYSLDGGTTLFAGTVRRRNQLRNQRKIFEMYVKDSGRIDRLLKEANRHIEFGSVSPSSRRFRAGMQKGSHVCKSR
jgi:glycosyltransferase involved in cell wall biosynthesis